MELYKDLKRDAARAPVPSTKVNDLCGALRALVESDVVKYVETILTTHVCKQPPDYEAGLRVLLQVQKEHPEIAQEAIKYIIFLSNVNQLFDVALGMYDFQLVLMVAQYSQKVSCFVVVELTPGPEGVPALPARAAGARHA